MMRTLNRQLAQEQRTAVQELQRAIALLANAADAVATADYRQAARATRHVASVLEEETLPRLAVLDLLH